MHPWERYWLLPDQSSPVKKGKSSIQVGENINQSDAEEENRGGLVLRKRAEFSVFLSGRREEKRLNGRGKEKLALRPWFKEKGKARMQMEAEEKCEE